MRAVPCWPPKRSSRAAASPTARLSCGWPDFTAPAASLAWPTCSPAGPWRSTAQGYLNLIHVDDAAALIVAAESRATPPRIYVLADGQPVRRRDFYQHLAALVGLPAATFTDPPPGDRSALRGGSDKRVRSARIFEELAVPLAYPSYREGLAATWLEVRS